MTTLTDINPDHQIDPQTPSRLLVGRSKVWSPDEAPETPTVTWETEESTVTWETEDGPEGATLRDHLYQKILSNWVDAAIRHNAVKEIAPGEFVATVAWIQGAIGYGASKADAVDSFRYGLADWLHLKLVDGDDDIPVLGGLNFNPL